MAYSRSPSPAMNESRRHHRYRERRSRSRSPPRGPRHESRKHRQRDSNSRYEERQSDRRSNHQQFDSRREDHSKTASASVPKQQENQKPVATPTAPVSKEPSPPPIQQLSREEEELLAQERRARRAEIQKKYNKTNGFEPVTEATPAAASVSEIGQHDDEPMTLPANGHDHAKDDPDPQRENNDKMSAVDYDASMDRQQRHSQLDAAIQAEEKPDSDPAAKRNKKPKKEIDMFASDAEDDDMSDEDGEVSSKAKALDQSMLDNWDDAEGYYKVINGELLDERYNIQATLGKGMFSTVIRALDIFEKKVVAIKIIRARDAMQKAANREVAVLNSLIELDPKDQMHLIRLERTFMHKDHFCMVFENLEQNLRDLLKKYGRDEGLSMMAVRAYAKQMFQGLVLLRKCNILHADLKPDNMLVSGDNKKLKICDLGSATEANSQDISDYMVSRFYRAPEVMLGMKCTFAIDMWSVGCTIFELFTGKILFTGRNNNQMLREIMESRGRIPARMLKKTEGEAVLKHFQDVDTFRSLEIDKVTGREVLKLVSLVHKPVNYIKPRLVEAADPSTKIADQEMKDISQLADLLEKCLALNPDKRITPDEALKHEFFRPATTQNKFIKSNPQGGKSQTSQRPYNFLYR